MTKQLLLLIAVLAAWSCGDDDGGDLTDGVNTDGGIGQFDAPSQERTCEPSGSCLQGPPCGDDCCGTGEQCVQREFGPECACGAGPACEVGDICSSGIPSEDQCGSVCCGGGGDPCPP